MSRGKTLAPDPCDVGAILRAALGASGLTAADVARRTGMAASNVSRALNSPDTRANVARRILWACGAHLEAHLDRTAAGAAKRGR